jgi:hypothetical protein
MRKATLIVMALAMLTASVKAEVMIQKRIEVIYHALMLSLKTGSVLHDDVTTIEGGRVVFMNGDIQIVQVTMIPRGMDTAVRVDAWVHVGENWREIAESDRVSVEGMLVDGFNKPLNVYRP